MKLEDKDEGISFVSEWDRLVNISNLVLLRFLSSRHLSDRPFFFVSEILYRVSSRV